MARSNNVLNTGFCLRVDRDSIERFSAALTSSPHSADEVKLGVRQRSKSRNGKSVEYAPPMREFNMPKTTLKAGEKETIATITGPCVLFAMSGTGKLVADGAAPELKEGDVFFVGQGTESTHEALTGLEVYQAYAEYFAGVTNSWRLRSHGRICMLYS